MKVYDVIIDYTDRRTLKSGIYAKDEDDAKHHALQDMETGDFYGWEDLKRNADYVVVDCNRREFRGTDHARAEKEEGEENETTD